MIRCFVVVLLLGLWMPASVLGLECEAFLEKGNAIMASQQGRLPRDKALLSQAKTHFQTAILLCPDLLSAEHPEVYLNLARICRLLDRDPEAIFYYKKAAETVPEPADAFLSLGILYERRELLGTAMHYYLKAMADRPDPPSDLTARIRRLARRQECPLPGTASAKGTPHEIAFEAEICEKAFAKARERLGLQ